MADTLAAALPREMVRVTRLACEYREFAAGMLVATLMDLTVERAQKAIEAADLAEMVLAYQCLKGFAWPPSATR